MRQMKVVDTGSVETTTLQVWSGTKLVSEYDVGDETRYDYLYGPSGMPLELMVTRSDDTTASYAYQCDAGGSVIGMTDEAGAEVARYAYDPYGNQLTDDGTHPIASRNPLRYRGYYLDSETQLYYLPARYYDPQSARFISIDPAPPSAGSPESLNRYSYCMADPVQGTDPTGAIIDVDGTGQATSEAHAHANMVRARSSERWRHWRRKAGADPMRTHHAAWLRHQARLRAQDEARMRARAVMILNHPDMEYFGLSDSASTGIGLRAMGAEVGSSSMKAGLASAGVALVGGGPVPSAVALGAISAGTGVAGAMLSGTGVVMHALGDPNYGGREARADFVYHSVELVVNVVGGCVGDILFSTVLNAPMWAGSELRE